MAEEPLRSTSVLLHNPERRAWMARGAPPPATRDGDLGEHLDTGVRLVAWEGQWHAQGAVKGTLVSSQKALAAAGDYAALDVMSESATEASASMWVFRGCARLPGEAFWIVRVGATCTEDSIANRLRIHLFRQATSGSVLGDNLAMALAEVDRPFYIAPPIDLAAFLDPGVPSITGDSDLRYRVTPDSTSRDLYAIVQTLDAEANETAAMIMRIELEIVWD